MLLSDDLLSAALVVRCKKSCALRRKILLRSGGGDQPYDNDHDAGHNNHDVDYVDDDGGVDGNAGDYDHDVDHVDHDAGDYDDGCDLAEERRKW